MRNPTRPNRPGTAAGLAPRLLALLLSCAAGAGPAADVRDHRGEGTLVAPPGFTFCARPGESCRLPVKANVAYGGAVPLADGRPSVTTWYVYRYDVSGSIACRDDSFPPWAPNAPKNVSKACYYKDARDHRGTGVGGDEPGPPGFSRCAEAGQRCQFRGIADVAAGVPGGTSFVFKRSVSNGIQCDQTGFHETTFPEWSHKACFVKLLPAPTAVPPTPVPTKTPVWQTPNVRDHR